MHSCPQILVFDQADEAESILNSDKLNIQFVRVEKITHLELHLAQREFHGLILNHVPRESLVHLITRIKATDPIIPIIVISPALEEMDLVHLINLRIFRFIKKPAPPHAVFAALSDAVEYSKKRGALSHLASMGEFAGLMLHEIGNPLAQLLMRTEQMIARLDGQQTQHQHLAHELMAIEKSVQKTFKVISGIRSLFADNHETLFEPITFREVERTLQKARGRTISHCGTHFEIKNRIPQYSLFGNNPMFTDALINLVDHALSGGLDPAQNTVVLDFDTECEGWARIEINSLGLAGRADMAGARLGIGLVFAKKVVETHRGTLSLERGARGPLSFVVRVPIYQTPL